MGASIYWQPVKGRSLSVGLRSRFVSALNLTSGGREFTSEDVPFLRGVAAGEPDFEGAVEAMIDAIHAHEIIRVWAEY